MNAAIETTMKALEQNCMVPHYVDHAAEVVPLLRSLLQEGDTVGVGGSKTLESCGVLELLRSGTYHFLDRYAPGLTSEQTEALHRAALCADVYLTSSNAVTEDGALVNMDGHSNRVAAMAYGPRTVIVVAGINKIVPDEAAARERIETVAAPLNAKRLSKKTPCTVTGKCEHCHSPQRICCNYLVQRQQLLHNRIHVVLVGEALGF